MGMCFKQTLQIAQTLKGWKSGKKKASRKFKASSQLRIFLFYNVGFALIGICIHNVQLLVKKKAIYGNFYTFFAKNF